MFLNIIKFIYYFYMFNKFVIIKIKQKKEKKMKKSKVFTYLVITFLLVLNIMALLNITSLNDQIDAIQVEEGPQGEIGPQGPKGDTGNAGPKGDQGIKGDTGDTGPKGDQGLQGPAGPSGTSGSSASALPYVSLGLALNQTYQSLNLYEEITNQQEYVQSKLDAGYIGISNQVELEAIGLDVEKTISQAKYVLTNNITLNPMTFSTILNFSGILDGANYSISIDYNQDNSGDLSSLYSISLFASPYKADFLNIRVNINGTTHLNEMFESGFIVHPNGFIRLVNVFVTARFTFNPNEFANNANSFQIGALFGQIKDRIGPIYIERSSGDLSLYYQTNQNLKDRRLQDIGALAGYIGEKNLVLAFDSEFNTTISGVVQDISQIGGAVGKNDEGTLIFKGVLSRIFLNLKMIKPEVFYVSAQRIAGGIGVNSDNSAFIVEQSILGSNIVFDIDAKLNTSFGMDFQEIGGAIGRIDDHPQILINNSIVIFDFIIKYDSNVASTIDNEINVYHIGGVFGRLEDHFSSAVFRQSLSFSTIIFENNSNSTTSKLRFNISSLAGVVGDMMNDEYISMYVIDSIVSFDYDESEVIADSTMFSSDFVGIVLGNSFRGTNVLDNVYAYSTNPNITGIDSSGWDYYANTTMLEEFNFFDINPETFVFKDKWDFENEWTYLSIGFEYLVPKAIAELMMQTGLR
jgi:hypothetical protein